jgi:hypothetical protein
MLKRYISNVHIVLSNMAAEQQFDPIGHVTIHRRLMLGNASEKQDIVIVVWPHPPLQKKVDPKSFCFMHTTKREDVFSGYATSAENMLIRIQEDQKQQDQ